MALKTISINTIDDLKALVVETTLAAGGAKKLADIKGEDKTSELFSTIEKAFGVGFHQYESATEAVVKVIVKHLTGEDIGKSHKYMGMPVKKSIRNGGFAPYQMVVPIANTNSHSYELGDPLMTYGSSTVCLKSNASRGNNLKYSDARYATIEEIDAFFAKIPDAAKFLATFEAQIK